MSYAAACSMLEHLTRLSLVLCDGNNIAGHVQRAQQAEVRLHLKPPVRIGARGQGNATTLCTILDCVTTHAGSRGA